MVKLVKAKFGLKIKQFIKFFIDSIIMKKVRKMSSNIFVGFLNKLNASPKNNIHFKGGLTFKMENARLNHHTIKVLRPTKKLSYDEGLKVARKILRSG
jgi:hypothetical protein